MRRFVRTWRSLTDDSLDKYQVIQIQSEKELLDQAKRLHAEVYLYRQFIDEDHIASNGHIALEHDPHQKHSKYFVVFEKDSKVVLAVARQIEWDESKQLDSLPVLKMADLYDDYKTLPPDVIKESVEISALSKKRGEPAGIVLMLYREMWHHSLQKNHQRWFMACDVRLYKQLKFLFGSSLIRIGNQTSYKGGDIIPVMLYPAAALEELKTSKNKLDFKTRLVRQKVIEFIERGST